MWKELIFKNDFWPEPGTNIYCDTCGGKNRRDDYWIYKEKQRNPENEMVARMMAHKMGIFGSLPPLQKNEYKCNYCNVEEKLAMSDIKYTKKQLQKFCKMLYKSTEGTKEELLKRLKGEK
jgi:hypothetical protein